MKGVGDWRRIEGGKGRRKEGRYKTMKVNIIIILSIYLIKIVHAKMKYIPVFQERNFDLRLKVIHREGGIKKKKIKKIKQVFIKK